MTTLSELALTLLLILLPVLPCSCSVFKKAAKLTLPHFDILALLGRARYFDALARNVPKALQALDSLIKLYPLFLPALEEKLRLLVLSTRFAEVPKLVVDLRTKRREMLAATDDAATAVQDSVAIAFAHAYEALTTTSGSGGKHTEAVRLLLAALARDEPSANAYWLWQYAQLFLRLARGAGPTDAVLLLLSEARDSAATAAAATGSKGPLLTGLQFERGVVCYRRGDFPAALAAFTTISETALTVEKAGKEDGEDDKAAGAESTAAAGKVNEDERWQKAQAHIFIVLVHLAQTHLVEAAQALQALPEEVSNYVFSTGEPMPLPALLYARAALAWAQNNDAAAASSALQQLCEAQANWMRERSPSDGTLGQPANGAPQGVNRFFLQLDPTLLLASARLGLAVVGLDVPDSSSYSNLPSTPPSSTDHADLLSALAGTLAHLTSPAILPGHAEAWALQSLLAWVLGDADAVQQALDKVEALEGSLPRVGALKRALQNNSVAAAAGTSAVSPAAASPPKTSQSLPLASAALSRAAAAASTPSRTPGLSAQKSPVVNFDDDDDDEDDGALFKSSADAVAEAASAGGVSAPLSFAALKAARASRDEELEREAQAVLDEMESRAGALTAKKAEQARALELERVRLENERKRARDEELRRAAEAEAALALEKASKAEQRAAELKKAEEIAALRAMREQEKKRQLEAIEQAEREREERREADRQERLRKRAAAEALASAGHPDDTSGPTEVTPIQAFGDASAVASSAPAMRPSALQTGLKWNQPHDPNPHHHPSNSMASPMSGGSVVSPLSLAQSPQGVGHPVASPLSAAPYISLQRPSASPTSQLVQSATSPRHGGDMQHEGHASMPVQRTAASAAATAAAHATPPADRELPSSPPPLDEASLRAQQQRDKIAEAGAQIEQAKKFTKVAFWGEVFLKHGRRGSPHERNVTLEVTGSELKFDWSSGQLKAHKSQLTLVEGKATPVFARTTATDSPSERCFSIVTANRSLDLEATSEATKEKWTTGIKLLLRYLK
jgi:hypothetical protein